jgi:23S rRNA pseudouridine1911/1915/1917 synthase
VRRVTPLRLLFRDPSLVVVDKPAGLPVEADSRECVTAVLARQLAPAGGRAWPRVVHRLDRETSGCLAVALTKAAELELRRFFDEGRVEKRYLALCAGAPPDEGTFDTPYGPDPKDRRRFSTRLTTSRRARLTFRVRERLTGTALIEVHLETGRTHQIRVQMADAGYPVVGDLVYGVKSDVIWRVALHAESLRFPHPAVEKFVECSAEVPGDLAEAIARLRAGRGN